MVTGFEHLIEQLTLPDPDIGTFWRQLSTVNATFS
jgi:hypothetical protein